MRQGYKVVWMNRVSAELTKYAANAMLATRISFMNEMSRLSEKVGADIEAVRRGIGVDPRIGKAFLYPGPGYGGSCFPKDVKAIIALGRKQKSKMALLESVEDVNRSQRDWFLKKILDFYKGDVKGKTFALWGLAFKANTDDVRETSAAPIVKGLLGKGAKVVAFDPQATETFKSDFGSNKHLTFVKRDVNALRGADGLVVLTEWQQFRSPDFEVIKKSLSAPVIFDARNLYDPGMLRDLGISYISVGRQSV
jgi:UDPglucose 6-dehydrogenase